MYPWEVSSRMELCGEKTGQQMRGVVEFGEMGIWRVSSSIPDFTEWKKLYLSYSQGAGRGANEK